MTDPTPLHPVTAEPVPEIVELLERWLEMARDGDIRCVAMVALRDNLVIRTGFAGFETVPQETTLIGAIETLKWDFMSEQNKEYVDD